VAVIGKALMGGEAAKAPAPVARRRDEQGKTTPASQAGFALHLFATSVLGEVRALRQFQMGPVWPARIGSTMLKSTKLVMRPMPSAAECVKAHIGWREADRVIDTP